LRWQTGIIRIAVHYWPQSAVAEQSWANSTKNLKGKPLQTKGVHNVHGTMHEYHLMAWDARQTGTSPERASELQAITVAEQSTLIVSWLKGKFYKDGIHTCNVFNN